MPPVAANFLKKDQLMTIMKIKFLVFFFLLCSIYGFAQIAENNYRDMVRTPGNSDKLALVIGNSNYQHISKPIYPAHDAKVIKEALKAQDYDVLEAYNLDRANLKATIRDLYKYLPQYKTLVVFYAGHGLEVNGVNYLVPTDANARAAIEVEDHCVKLDYLFARIDNPDIAKLVVLDACRNNPFSDIRGEGNGIARIHHQKKNTKIIFSTASATTVKDDNPFAEIFAQHIRQGGCIENILLATTDAVEQKRRDQIIWQQGSLKENICFGDMNSMTEDSDGDGLVDEIDACPKRPGKAANNGCPPDPIPDGMVLVEGGEFMMGCTPEQGVCEVDEKPVHQVYVDDFLMAEHEVTISQFKAFVDATGHRTTAEKEGDSWVWNGSSWDEKSGVSWRDDVAGNRRPYSDYSHPVIHISWHDAVAYCKWLSTKEGRTYRLPTESEWEYAARGGKYVEGTIYSGGNSLSGEGWYISNSGGSTRPVMCKRPNALGLYDMSGNVREWCSDWYGDYNSGYQRNPTGISGGFYRVFRGGGWNADAVNCRVAARRGGTPSYRMNAVGFRVVASPV